MKRILFILLMAMATLHASAFINRYTIVSRLENGADKPCDGTISVVGYKNGEGLVTYSRLTVYVSEVVNNSWQISKKTVVDEQTVRLEDADGARITMEQKNDSVVVFRVPMFYGSQRGSLTYTAVYRKERILSENATDEVRSTVGTIWGKAKDKARSIFSGSGQPQAAEEVEEDDLDDLDEPEEPAAKPAQSKAEQPAEPQEDARTTKAQNAMQGLFGSGSAAQQKQAGPAGYGTSNGIDWVLPERELVGQLLKPAKPEGKEGKVVVRIRVDADGTVLEAVRAQGSTDAALVRAAIDAAKQARFSEGYTVAGGTITYIF